MTIDRHMALCERIWEHCRHLEYYGPNLRLKGIEHRGYFDANGKLQVQVITHDPHTSFEFPPATEEQLQATKEALGIPLPPMLRALYAQVANGGFGPAYGITGEGGKQRIMWTGDEELVEPQA